MTEINDGKITIRGGQGISQAIRNELGLSQAECNKLGKSVWSKIFEQVDKQNELGKIYDGGNDPFGGKENYIVYPNQVIEFSKEIWAEIVRLVNDKLGKDIKVNKNVNTSITTEDKNPPQNLSEKYTKPDLSKAGKNITDNTTGEKITYNDQCYISWVRDKDGATIYERYDEGISHYLHDNDNNGLIINYNLDGSVKEYTRYKFDDRGKTIAGTLFNYNADGTVK